MVGLVCSLNDLIARYEVQIKKKSLAGVSSWSRMCRREQEPLLQMRWKEKQLSVKVVFCASKYQCAGVSVFKLRFTLPLNC